MVTFVELALSVFSFEAEKAMHVKIWCGCCVLLPLVCIFNTEYWSSYICLFIRISLSVQDIQRYTDKRF